MAKSRNGWKVRVSSVSRSFESSRKKEKRGVVELTSHVRDERSTRDEDHDRKLLAPEGLSVPKTERKTEAGDEEEEPPSRNVVPPPRRVGVSETGDVSFLVLICFVGGVVADRGKKKVELSEDKVVEKEGGKEGKNKKTRRT